jgi:geranylgeranyl diphosphate synthase type 3
VLTKPYTFFNHEVDKDCIECFYYILANPGKNVRSILIDAFQLWLRVPLTQVEAIKEVVTKLHTASLLVDDIEDNAKVRRGEPAAHTIFGTPSVINGANYVYFLAMKEVYDLQNPAAVKVFTEELLNLHRGQGQDILWRDRAQCPTEEQYRGMVLDKTGGLFRLAVGLMQAFSACATDFTPFVNQLAFYFQVRDDYMNLVSSVYMQNKSFAEDITEGKFSFPIIHGIRANPKDSKLLLVIKQRTDDVTLKKFAVKWMYEAGSFDYTRKVLIQVHADLLQQLEALGGNRPLRKLIDLMHVKILEDERENEGDVPSPLVGLNLILGERDDI